MASISNLFIEVLIVGVPIAFPSLPLLIRVVTCQELVSTVGSSKNGKLQSQVSDILLFSTGGNLLLKICYRVGELHKLPVKLELHLVLAQVDRVIRSHLDELFG